MKLSSQEVATVLAALRYWQIDVLEIEGANRGDAHFGDFDPLTVEEVDDLCERINFDDDGEQTLTMADKERFTFLNWQLEVANGDTKIGYEDWVLHKLEAEKV